MPVIDLIDKLQEKGWMYKRELYTPYFENIHFLNEVEKPQMSVVIISWRLHPDTIKNFEVLQNQRDKHQFELIFVDNGGETGEFDTLKPFIDTYIRLNQNTGAYLARNVGALFCRAPIILFLEDDGIPDAQLIESHHLVHRKYDVIAVRGVYLYKTNTQLNERQSHYFLGKRFFPRYSNVEGNSSYSTCEFFEVGGWDDEIQFGGGGNELAIRLYQRYPAHEKQIYSPISIIYHDYASDEVHLEKKLLKQKRSFKRLHSKHKNWNSFMISWLNYYGAEHTLVQRESWQQKDELLFLKVRNEILSRNKEKMSIERYKKAFVYDGIMLSKIINEQNKDKMICIFGTGSFGERIYQALIGHGLRVNSFSDNNSELWNENKYGLRIVPPHELTDKYYILIASSWGFEIAQQLESMGFTQLQHFVRVI